MVGEEVLLEEVAGLVEAAVVMQRQVCWLDTELYKLG